MEARRGTVVDRKSQHRKTISTDRVSLQYKYMSSAEIDDEIKSKTQQGSYTRCLCNKADSF